MGYDGVASGYPTPTGFRRLTGCQQDPQDRGVTTNAIPHGSHAMYLPLSLPSGIHMVMPCGTTPCVIRHPCLEIHEIPTGSESNKIRLGR